MKKNQKKIDLSNFEKLSEASTGSLVGGFSVAKSGPSTNLKAAVNLIKCTTTNNCDGGNCISGCGG
ncbi:MAG TPA: hypothetical protein PLF48_00590 [Chitinophagales bacterium]|nr:hypothetical protein [Chitinophagales bacterium]